jgi:hypothetical protein
MSTPTFGRYLSRDQTAAMLEEPVRAGDQEAIAAILAELDRLDTVAAAQKQVAVERAARKAAAEATVLALVQPAVGQCRGTVSGEWRSSPCRHPAKSMPPGGQGYCGVHFRRAFDRAVYKELDRMDQACAGEYSEAERPIADARAIERARA